MKYILILIFIFLILRNYKRFYNDQNDKHRHYTLLIAHPDDESMFFAPTINNLKKYLHIICLSKGDKLFKFDTLREAELKNLCYNYQIKLSMYNFFDNENWNTEEICNILFLHYLQYPSTVFITFDGKGVSGHKNHISCYEAVKCFTEKYHLKSIYLKSLNLFQKYIWNYEKCKIEYKLSFENYFTAVSMMLYHKSQLLWFRYLYLLFSSYTSYNSYL